MAMSVQDHPVFHQVRRPATTPFVIELDRASETAHSDLNTARSNGGAVCKNEQQNQVEPEAHSTPPPRFIVAIDFGTTYSTVAYIRVEQDADTSKLGLGDILCIDSYENAGISSDSRMNARYENVPTELLYFSPSYSDSEASDSDSGPCGTALEPDPGLKDAAHALRRRGGRASRKRTRDDIEQSWLRQGRVEWGYRVQHLQKHPQELRSADGSELVRLIKLSLGDAHVYETNDQHPGENGISNRSLSAVRRDLADQIARLQQRQAVRSVNDILADYLVRLLRHTKSVLRRKEGLTTDSRIEYVLSVPVSWSPAASQTMTDVLVRAVRVTGLGKLVGESIIPNLFIVSEPEAAAQCVLASLGDKGRLRKNQVFVLLDAGGGTVDITTYEVSSDGLGPLRLRGEIVPAEGALCGSSLINEAYRKRLLERLDATDFAGGEEQLKNVVAGLVANFEVSIKPYIDFTQKKTLPRRIYIDALTLRHNPTKGIRDRSLKFSEEEVREMFKDSLEGTTRLLESQLDRAAAENLTVTNVVVVGGFGESPALRTHLEAIVSRRENLVGGKIGLIWPYSRGLPTSTVARGAVLRSLHKKNGPERISKVSYGFLRTEPYKDWPEHEREGLKPSIDKIDGYEYVKDTVLWVVQQGDTLQTSFTSKPIISSHTFSMDPRVDPILGCVECLYVSPKRSRSHFPLTHKENAGAILLGQIEIDMTEHRKSMPRPRNGYAGTARRRARHKHLDVTFDLVLIVEGKTLMYEAHWPSRSQADELGDVVRVTKTGYVSLAPYLAFGAE